MAEAAIACGMMLMVLFVTNTPKLATDPHFRDYVLFHEYFHGDNGRGVGASHQTGWTGLVAKLLQPRRMAARPAPAKPRKSAAKPRSTEAAMAEA